MWLGQCLSWFTLMGIYYIWYIVRRVHVPLAPLHWTVSSWPKFWARAVNHSRSLVTHFLATSSIAWLRQSRVCQHRWYWGGWGSQHFLSCFSVLELFFGKRTHLCLNHLLPKGLDMVPTSRFPKYRKSYPMSFQNSLYLPWEGGIFAASSCFGAAFGRCR